MGGAFIGRIVNLIFLQHEDWFFLEIEPNK